MARTKKTIGYDAVFPTRLRMLLDESEDNGKRGGAAALAKAIGLQPQSISGWRRGESAPDFENLIKIADHFDVSVDWLLGRVQENNRSSDADLMKIGEYTELSTDAIKELHINPKLGYTISNLLATTNGKVLIDSIGRFLYPLTKVLYDDVDISITNPGEEKQVVHVTDFENNPPIIRTSQGDYIFGQGAADALSIRLIENMLMNIKFLQRIKEPETEEL